MMAQDVVGFWKWVNEERERRRLSFRAMQILAGGQPNGKLNKRAAQGQPPTLDNCQVIAKAFGVPLETVLRRANLLPEAGRPELEEIYGLVEQLTPENLAVLATVVRGLVNNQREAGPEPGRFRVIGLPELPERPYSAEDFDQFLQNLTDEERELLADAMGPDGGEDEAAGGA
jgi:hypothetical protein